MTLTRTSAKGYFETNDRPTQGQFAELFEGIVFQQGTSAQFVQSNVSAQGNWDFKANVTVSGALTANSITLNSVAVSSLVVTASATVGILGVTGSAALTNLTVTGSGNTALTGNLVVSGVPTFAAGLEKCVNSTWNTANTGVQTVTGTGFTPKSVQIMMNIDSTKIISDGWTDGSAMACRFYDVNGAIQLGSTGIIVAARTQTGVTESQAAFTSFTNDGMTMTWTKTGSPTGTANLFFKFSR